MISNEMLKLIGVTKQFTHIYSSNEFLFVRYLETIPLSCITIYTVLCHFKKNNSTLKKAIFEENVANTSDSTTCICHLAFIKHHLGK